MLERNSKLPLIAGRSARSGPFGRLRRGREPEPGIAAAFGRADQALLRLMRTRLHQKPIERSMQALGLAGEWAAVWVSIGATGAIAIPERRRRFAIAAAVGPAAVAANFAVKVLVGRERPLIEDHPALAKAPSKLSFPSAHATSSLAAATALARVAPEARLPLFALAAKICVSRPYLGMHYPSDVLAGAVLGLVIGRLVPGLDRDDVDFRMESFAAETNGGAPYSPAEGAGASA